MSLLLVSREGGLHLPSLQTLCGSWEERFRNNLILVNSMFEISMLNISHPTQKLRPYHQPFHTSMSLLFLKNLLILFPLVLSLSFFSFHRHSRAHLCLNTDNICNTLVLDKSSFEKKCLNLKYTV